MQAIDLQGIVTPYKGNGRKLGYPTANLNVATDLKDGVYFGFASLTQYINQPAMIFIGVPTTMGDTERRLEVHLLDIPDIDYYGQSLAVKICHYHRANMAFHDVKQLLAAIATDETAGRAWFSQNQLESIAQ